MKSTFHIVRKGEFILTLSIVLFTVMVCPLPASGQDRAVVIPRKVVLVRRGQLARDFPANTRATVKYPVISGLRDALVLRKVRNLLQVNNAFGSSLEDYRGAGWLTNFYYRVNYNKYSLLDITFTEEGTGAYPDTHHKHFLISLKTGEVVKASEAFNPGSLETLRAMAEQKLQAAIKDKYREIEGRSDLNEEDKASYKEPLQQLTYKVEDLDEFSVSDRGITFLFDPGFPHVIAALQPDGKYFFPYSELRTHLNHAGPLGIFIPDFK